MNDDDIKEEIIKQLEEERNTIDEEYIRIAEEVENLHRQVLEKKHHVTSKQNELNVLQAKENQLNLVIEQTTLNIQKLEEQKQSLELAYQELKTFVEQKKSEHSEILTIITKKKEQILWNTLGTILSHKDLYPEIKIHTQNQEFTVYNLQNEFLIKCNSKEFLELKLRDEKAWLPFWIKGAGWVVEGPWIEHLFDTVNHLQKQLKERKANKEGAKLATGELSKISQRLLKLKEKWRSNN